MTVKYLWRQPVCRNNWRVLQTDLDKPRHELWQELFFDLFYVALFLKLGNIIKYCGYDFDQISSVFATYLIAYLTFYQMSMYINRFFTEDLVHKLFFLGVNFGLFMMILNVNDVESSQVSSLNI